MRQRFQAVLFVALAACGSKQPVGERPQGLHTKAQAVEGDEREAVTHVAGRVFATGTVLPSKVELFALRSDEAEPQKLAEANIGENGAFDAKAGPYEGPALVIAEFEGLHQPLMAMVAELEIGKQKLDVMVTPVTTLAAARTIYLVNKDGKTKQGRMWAKRIAEGQSALNLHFFSIQHQHVDPKLWENAAGGGAGNGGAALQVDERILAGLIGPTLETQAKALSAKLPEPDVTWNTLLKALVADVKSDGTFDGRLGDESPVYLAPHRVLSAEALRLDFAQALFRHLQEVDAVGSEMPEPLRRLVNNLSRTSAPLFSLPVETTPSDTTPPELLGCSVAGMDGQPRDNTKGQVGTVRVTCNWTDNRQVRRSWVEPFNGQDLSQRTPTGAEVLSFDVDLDAAKRARPDLGELRLFVSCEDEANNVSSDDYVLKLAGPGPQIEVLQEDGAEVDYEKVVWLKRGEGLRIRGRVHGSNPTLELVHGRDTYVAELQAADDAENTFNFVFPLVPECAGEQHVELIVTDEAGVSVQKNLRFACYAKDPQIVAGAVSYQQDFSLATDRAQRADGWSQSGQRFEKWVDALDYHPERDTYRTAPEISFKAIQPDAIAGSEPLTVEYRYLHGSDGEIKRNWSPMVAADQDTYKLVLSYQNLLPQDLLKHPTATIVAKNNIFRSKDDERHVVQVRATNAGGVQTVAEYSFYITIRSQMVTVSKPIYTDLIGEYSYALLRDERLGLMPVAEAHLQWPVPCKTGALYPCPKAKVSFKTVEKKTVHKIATEEREKSNSGLKGIPHFPCREGKDRIRTHGVSFAKTGCRNVARNNFGLVQSEPLTCDLHPFADDMTATSTYELSPGTDRAVPLARSHTKDSRNPAWLAPRGSWPGAWQDYTEEGYEFHGRHVHKAIYTEVAAQVCMDLSLEASVEVEKDFPAPLGVYVDQSAARYCWDMK